MFDDDLGTHTHMCKIRLETPRARDQHTGSGDQLFVHAGKVLTWQKAEIKSTTTLLMDAPLSSMFWVHATCSYRKSGEIAHEDC